MTSGKQIIISSLVDFPHRSTSLPLDSELEHMAQGHRFSLLPQTLGGPQEPQRKYTLPALLIVPQRGLNPKEGDRSEQWMHGLSLVLICI